MALTTLPPLGVELLIPDSEHFANESKRSSHYGKIWAVGAGGIVTVDEITKDDRYLVAPGEWIQDWLDGEEVELAGIFNEDTYDEWVVILEELRRRELGLVESQASWGGAHQAHHSKTFPKGDLADPVLTELAIKLAAELESTPTRIGIVRDFCKTHPNEDPDKLDSRIRKAEGDGKVVLPKKRTKRTT